MLANLIYSAGFQTFGSSKKDLLGPSEFNKSGYFENKFIALLNDQIIRMNYGEDCSNLYLPISNYRNRKNLKNLTYKYDLEGKTVYFPPNFLKKKKQYTGTDWDVWGISRMLPGHKWHKIFSKYKIRTAPEILKAIKKVKRIVNSSKKRLVLKDPRFVFTLQFFKFDKKQTKIIILRRQKKSVLKSIRRHFGKNMFYKKYINGPLKIVSNHFNYKIKYQSFSEYCKVHNLAINKAAKGYEKLIVNYEDILQGHQIQRINRFIESSVDKKIIRQTQ